VVYFFIFLGGLRNDISFKVIQPEAIKADKGREGGPKIGKMGRRRLWMAPYINQVSEMLKSGLVKITK
jgi:hypothetical protein